MLARARDNLSSQNPLEPFQDEYREADSRVQQLIERVSHEKLDDDFTEVKHKLQNIKNMAMQSGQALVAMERFFQESARKAVLQWVFPTVETGHAAIRNKLQDNVKVNAGKWLLNTTEFKQWEEGKGPGGLWLEGEGQTSMMPLTPQKYGATGASGMPTGVFYCSGVRDSYESNDTAFHTDSGASDIIRSLVRQIGQTTEGFQLLEREYQAYPRAGLDVSPLQLTDAKRLLRSPVQMQDMSFIVLDALDECLAVGQDKERLNVMELFDDLLADQTSVKIFVSSRFEPDIQDYLREWASIKLYKNWTEGDLSSFVDLTIDRKLTRKRGCDDRLRSQLKMQLKDKAEGNFRWTQLSLDYICEPTRPARDLLSVLDRIPRKLNDFYSRFLSEVKDDNSDFNRSTGVKAIALLLATTDLKMGLRTCDFLRLITPPQPDSQPTEEGDITVDDVRVACHHLVVHNETANVFEFGHFSVAEFFHANPQTNAHHAQVAQDFGPEPV
ncbi:hypothetical protein QBC34DRAFT_223631 [Podospora aff. communis PSN243]|uniref:Nephrocystin 3-like N-terminal domain-containing protein n=1 Tax=Podospora aff. communis PSN243 TaxID=3040156 RepID=A0AAV9G2A3_9PEZI|nr:hypothetical protein QBC34DRAFT_223631 [Podospora aff. communis PSN243]